MSKMKKTYKLLYSLIFALGLGVVSCNDDLAMPPVPVPEAGETGIGTWDNPMTAAQVLAGFVNDSIAQPWATGYIVGYCNTAVSNTMSAASAVLDPNGCTVATNILISYKNPLDEAQRATLTWEDCATVQLPSGPVRNALNLSDNPDRFGELVTLRGTTGSKYCGAYGIRSVSDYVWGDKGKESTEPEIAPVPYLWQGWDTSSDFNTYRQEGWQIRTVSGSVLGWGIATNNNQNYIVATAYSAPANEGPYEDWLVSPAVNIDNSVTKTLTFTMRSGYKGDDSTMEVWLMKDNEPVQQLQANIPEAPADGYSEWATTTIDLSSLSGVYKVAWRYRTEHGGRNCTAYCLDNINIGGAPEVIYAGLDGSAAGINWTYENINLGGLSTIWSWTERNGGHYLYGTAYSGGSREALAYAVSPVIDLTGMTRIRAQFEHAAYYQRNIKQLCGFVVRIAGESEWTQLTIPNWPAAGNWNFAKSGEIDLSAFEGKQIQVGFKYASTAQNADSWEIRNFQITGKSK